MLLREYLEEYTRQELLDQARSLEIKKCSGLRKAALIDRIMECFCTEEMLRGRLSCLTREQLDLFCRACEMPQHIAVHEIMNGMQLCRFWFGTFEELTDRFCVFEEICEIFGENDDEAFRKEQYKKGWMMKCVQFFINYYGIAPVEIIYELYKLKVHDTIEEMVDMLWEMPVDMVESCIFPMEKLGIQDWPEDSSIYSSIGLLIHIPILRNNAFGALLDQQRDKDFYIPSAKQMEEICSIGYEASALAYKKLETFFREKMNMSYEHVVTWCFQVWTNGYEGKSPSEVINRMTEADISFKSEKQMQEFIGLLMDAYNNTRMKENRGYKPDEMIKREFSGGLNENAAKGEKNVYPNDPCPCGSGKKYKKCCGRK